MPARRPHAGTTSFTTTHAGLRYVPCGRPAHPHAGTTASAMAACAAPARPLRVVRVVDGKGQQRNDRVVISGRMADVCAELDRLAALEAADHGARRTARHACIERRLHAACQRPCCSGRVSKRSQAPRHSNAARHNGTP
jgi:hypothetical protein